MIPGRFIVLEGGEGTGKTTQSRTVVEWLSERGRQVVSTREPGGTPLAEAIRALALGDWEEGVSSKSELLLIFAARSAHLETLIRPTLQRGIDVVCDRFVDSSYAYQGAGRGLPDMAIDWLANFVVGTTVPDLVLLLDQPPESAIARTNRRGGNNRFERESAEFQQRVREAYQNRAKLRPGRYALIDASQPPPDVRNAIRQALERRFEGPHER